jgi:hypothetical protein
MEEQILWLMGLCALFFGVGLWCGRATLPKKTAGRDPLIQPSEPWPRIGRNGPPTHSKPPAPPAAPSVFCKCGQQMPEELEALCSALPARAAMLVRRSWAGR